MTRPHERLQDASRCLWSYKVLVQRLIETERLSVEVKRKVQPRDKLYQQSICSLPPSRRDTRRL